MSFRRLSCLTRLVHEARSKLGLTLCLAAILALAPGRAAAGESLTEITLKRIAERQRTLLAEAAAAGEAGTLDRPSFRSQAEQLCHEYESLLRESADYAPGYAAYGYLLWKLGMRKEAAAILLRANQLDPNIALVKNELGNYLAEDGKPLDALEYFLGAIKLEPKEPLYHYQLGTLLYEARSDFVNSGEWTRAAVDRTMLEAFRQAALLAPNRIEFTYRYAEAFYDLENPDWDTALAAWRKLEATAPSEVERETMRLHQANILLKRDQPARARQILDTVTAPELQAQKQKLVAAIKGNPGN
jgi:tetratricopeptide (TPR) repeat protein